MTNSKLELFASLLLAISIVILHLVQISQGSVQWIEDPITGSLEAVGRDSNGLPLDYFRLFEDSIKNPNKPKIPYDKCINVKTSGSVYSFKIVSPCFLLYNKLNCIQSQVREPAYLGQTCLEYLQSSSETSPVPVVNLGRKNRTTRKSSPKPNDLIENSESSENFEDFEYELPELDKIMKDLFPPGEQRHRHHHHGHRHTEQIQIDSKVIPLDYSTNSPIPNTVEFNHSGTTFKVKFGFGEDNLISFDSEAKMCIGVDKFGESWEVSPGRVMTKLCSNILDSTGNVYWACDNFGKFVTEQPTYSNCQSKVFAEIGDTVQNQIIMNKRTNGKIHVSAAGEVLATIANRVQKSPIGPKFYGHEIKGILTLMRRVVNSTEGKSLADAETLFGSSLPIFYNIVSESSSWDTLKVSERAETATNFIETLEDTLFDLAKFDEKDGSSKSYTKEFTRTEDFKVLVGTMSRNDEEPIQEFLNDSKESHIKLPKNWKSSIPKGSDGDGRIRWVKLSLSKSCLDNMIPSTRKVSSINRDMVNTKLTSLTLSNSDGPVSVKFPNDGVRITFNHEGHGWGSDGNKISRKLHENEIPASVLGSSVCVYWDTHLFQWSSKGCKVIESGPTFTTCECNHLTSFAVLMNSHQYIGKDLGLTIITRILCSLSVLFLLFTILIFRTLHSVRNPRTSVTIHLCVFLLIGNLLVLTLMDRNNFPVSEGLCVLTGMISHFIFLTAFVWMGIEGFIVYKMVVDVFDSGTENKIKLRLIAYGLPTFVVLLFSVIQFLTGSGPVYGGELYCWLVGDYIWAFTGPVFLICAGNIFVLITALRKAYHKGNSTLQVKQSVRQSRTMILGTMSLTCLLGITCIFGFLMAGNNVILGKIGAYLFTIFNASQGIFIFIFHCWMNKQVRKSLRRKASIWHSGSHFTSSSVNESKSKDQENEKSKSREMVSMSSSGTRSTRLPSEIEAEKELYEKLNPDPIEPLPNYTDTDIDIAMEEDAKLDTNPNPATDSKDSNNKTVTVTFC